MAVLGFLFECRRLRSVGFQLFVNTRIISGSCAAVPWAVSWLPQEANCSRLVKSSQFITYIGEA